MEFSYSKRPELSLLENVFHQYDESKTPTHCVVINDRSKIFLRIGLLNRLSQLLHWLTIIDVKKVS